MSNRLPHLQAEAARLARSVRHHDLAAIRPAIEAGRALIEAKGLCRHGQWGAWLKGVGIAERTGQRWMALARAELEPATVADLGGIRAAAEFLAYHAEHVPGWPAEHVAQVLISGRIISRAQKRYPEVVRRAVDYAIETDPDRMSEIVYAIIQEVADGGELSEAA